MIRRILISSPRETDDHERSVSDWRQVWGQHRRSRRPEQHYPRQALEQRQSRDKRFDVRVVVLRNGSGVAIANKLRAVSNLVMAFRLVLGDVILNRLGQLTDKGIQRGGREEETDGRTDRWIDGGNFPTRSCS